MRNDLTKENNLNQSGVINLDEKDGPGTHWTAYKKNKTQIIYFHSYGNLRPPMEVVKHFNSKGQ